MIRKIGEQADNIGKDSNGRDRTIYDVGWGTLIGRNLVAGMSRALGGLIFNILLLLVIGSFLAKFVWPQLQASYQTILSASEMLNKAGSSLTSGGGNNVLPLFGEKVRFDIQDLGNPGSESKSIELSPDQLEKLLFQNK